MKAKINNKELIIFGYTKSELKKLEKLLTYEKNKYDAQGEHEKLFGINKDNQLITYWGLYELLKKEFKIELVEVINCPNKFSKDIGLNEISDTILKGITLYKFQKFCAYKCINNKFGSVISATGSGKSEIILTIIQTLLQTKRIQNNICLVMPNVTLAEQFVSRAIKRGISRDIIGAYHGTEKTYNKQIIVFVINSLYQNFVKKNPKLLEFLDNVDLTIFDESHHIQSITYLTMAKNIQCKYMFGFSGSLYQDTKDILASQHDTIIQGFFGPPIFRINIKHLYELGLLAKPLIFMQTITGRKGYQVASNYNKLYEKHITENKTRNNKIVSLGSYILKMGLRTLITVQRKQHGIDLLNQFKSDKVACMYGGKQLHTYDEHLNVIDSGKFDLEIFIKNFEKGIYKTVIVSQVGDEGLDLPNVNAYIMAGGGRSNIKITQRIGRALRRKKHKNIAIIIDFNDLTHFYFKAQSIARRKIYELLHATITENVIDIKQEIDEIGMSISEEEK